MIDSTAAVSAATGVARPAGAASAAKTTAVKGAKDFAGELAKAASTSDPATKVAPRPDGEQTKKIAHHPYARIESGADKGLFLNQLAGNARQGSVFRMVERNDRVFHVYGTGKDKVIIGMQPQGKSDATAGGTPATTG